MTGRRYWRRHRREQGAVAVMVALVTCFVLIPIGALTVDIGMQRVARGDMQSLADTVALDMARSLASGVTPTNTLAATSAATVSGTIGTTPAVRVVVGYIANSPTGFVSDQSLGCGSSSTYNPYFQDASALGKTPNAVLVTASSSVKFAFAGGSGGVCRSSLAGTVGAACYDVGSYAAAVASGNSALVNPFFRQVAQQVGVFSNSASVMAIDYQGLAQSQVDLNQLSTGLGLGSPSDLATATVRLRDFYTAILGSMTAPTNATNVTALGVLAASASSASVVDLGKILAVSAGTGSLASATMNALDLVGGSLDLLNGTNVASVNVGTGLLAGIANANAQVTLVQGPHHFCGSVGSVATTSTDPSLTQQLGVVMHGTVNPTGLGITVPGVAGLLQGTSATVSLPNDLKTSVSVAPTSTTVTGISCSTVKGIALGVTNGLAKVTLETQLSNLQVNATLLNLTIVGLPVASLSTKVSISGSLSVTATVSPSGVVSFAINVPNQLFDTFYPTSSTGLGVSSPVLTSPSIQIQSNATVLGIITTGATVSLSAGDQSSVVNAILGGVARSLLDNTNPGSFFSTVVNPILGLLGTNVGGSQIDLSSHPAPSCNQPVTLG